jgi:hypothetical protein
MTNPLMDAVEQFCSSLAVLPKLRLQCGINVKAVSKAREQKARREVYAIWPKGQEA